MGYIIELVQNVWEVEINAHANHLISTTVMSSTRWTCDASALRRGLFPLLPMLMTAAACRSGSEEVNEPPAILGECASAPNRADVHVVGIEAGAEHTCALLSPCGALCWGANISGEVGTDAHFVIGNPTWVARSLPLRQASLGNSHTCGIDQADTVWCWGDNADGQLTEDHAGTESADPVHVKRLAAAQQLAAGGWATAALLTGAEVSWWGAGEWSPVLIPGFAGALAVANGGTHFCVLEPGGTVLCAGGNTFGQLGNGTTDPKESAIVHKVIGLREPATALALGSNVSCAIGGSSAVYCWGQGDGGVLGNGSLDNQVIPTRVPDLEEVVALDLQAHACAVLRNGNLKCWGSPVFDLDAYEDTVLTPVEFNGVSRVVDVAIGWWYTCVLTEDQEIYCWGENGAHQLGLGDSSPLFVREPTRVDWRAALP